MIPSSKSSDNSLNQSKKIVFRLLRYRIYSEKEITDRLKIKGFSSKTITETIKYFKTVGMVNNRIFAREWINARLHKLISINLIENELKQKGISIRIIESELNKIKTNYNELENIAILAQKQIIHYKNLDKNTIERRLFGFLSRRGFSHDSILKVIFSLKGNSYESK